MACFVCVTMMYMCVAHACKCADVHVEAKTGCQVSSYDTPSDYIETGSFSECENHHFN